jgi:peptide/nickel transport system substrate-binding protein
MMKDHTFSTRIVIAIVACLVVLPVAWAQQAMPGGTLRVAWEADISGLDPHLSFGMQARLVVGNLFNSLVTIDGELNFVPDLAESWEVLENSKVYVFHLRKGVTFHDGTDFDAEAVRWNYRRIVDPEEKTLDAPYDNGIVEAVDVLDAHTVKFTLKHPTRTMLAALAADRVGFLLMSPASYKRRRINNGAEKTSGYIRWARGRSNSPNGNKTRSSCWRRIPTTSSRGCHTWTASSYGS